MSILFEAVEPMSSVVHHFNRFDEDGIDRLNHKYSTIVFCILAIVVTTNQYIAGLSTPTTYAGYQTLTMSLLLN
ncbi:hypothetical protein EB796_004808 [Bugula neritina]|uniref:Uncharacterized protein n=1 Tax=Bugula neritina TaxID=10212 RepID=A0A7J7KDZ9_BUGNE|nr:hypothetical protein EB796_004808 [Bugula neritina]